MKIAICEDNAAHAELLIAAIEKWADQKDIKVTICAYQSASEFLYHWSKEGPYALTFLDIQMGVMDGLELAQLIRKQDGAMQIVFVTGLGQHFSTGFRLDALQYLVKPVNEDELRLTLDKAYDRNPNRKYEVVLIPIENGMMRVYWDEIYYFENERHYVIAHTKKGDFRYKKKFADLVSELEEPTFCRCHQSFLVNMNYVSKYQNAQVEVENGDTLPISRAGLPRMHDCLVRSRTEAIRR